MTNISTTTPRREWSYIQKDPELCYDLVIISMIKLVGTVRFGTIAEWLMLKIGLETKIRLTRDSQKWQWSYFGQDYFLFHSDVHIFKNYDAGSFTKKPSDRGATKRFISLGGGWIIYFTWCFFNIRIKIEKKALILNWSLFQILRSFPADFLNWFDKVLTQVNLLHCLLTLSKLTELLSWRVQWKTHWTRI